MSFNLNVRLNNLSATTNNLLNDVSDLQNLIASFLTETQAQTLYQLISNMASTYNSNPSSLIYYNARYINSLISNYQLISNIASTYNSNPSSLIYYNASYINSLISNYQLISNIASTYNSNPSSLIYYNATYINSLISNYQKNLTVSLPLSLSATNTLSIDLSNYATKSNLSSAIANLVNSAPATLDTLNEIATALNNDPNFATTITNLIGSKQAQITASSPLSLSATNTLSINLSNYATQSNLSAYQRLITVSSPLSLSATNALSIDLSNYVSQSNLSTYQPLITSSTVLDLNRITCSSITTNDVSGGSMTFSRYNSYISYIHDQGFTHSYDNRELDPNKITSILSSSPTGTSMSFRSNSITNSVAVDSSGVSISGPLTCDYIKTTKNNGISVYDGATQKAQINANGNINTSGSISSGPLFINNSSTSSKPLIISYASTDICTVSNDGKINCNSLQTNETDGILIYDGATKNAQIYSSGNISTSGSLRITGTNSNATNAISFYDKINGNMLWKISNAGGLTCNFLTLNGSMNIYDRDIRGNPILTASMEVGGDMTCKTIAISDRANTGLTTASITNDGDIFSRNITCKGIAIADNTYTQVINASINNDGDILSRDIICRRITISGTLFKQPVETIIMSCSNPTTNPTGATVPGWSFTWQGNGRNLKVSCQISCFSVLNSVLGTWSLRRRIVGSSSSSEVASGKFYFNQPEIHLTMPTIYYVDISRTTQNIEYFVATGQNIIVDTNDVCTMITTEYF